MFHPQHEVHPPHGVLLHLVKREDPRGAMFDLVKENRFSSIDKEEAKKQEGRRKAKKLRPAPSLVFDVFSPAWS